jgi:hypothetical protein
MAHSLELSRRLQVRSLGPLRLGETALETTIEATEAECARLAQRLGVPAVVSLQCRFRLSGVDGDGRISADGLLQSALTRVCVTTLEEFETRVVERFSVRFVPDGVEAAADEDDLDLDADDDVPYSGSGIDLGEAAVEQLALAMDPYPRRPGAILPEGIGSVDVPGIAADDTAVDEDGGDEGEARPNPFAALANRGRSVS